MEDELTMKAHEAGVMLKVLAKAGDSFYRSENDQMLAVAALRKIGLW